MSMSDTTIITPSYRDDYHLAVELCRSVDEYVSGASEHVLIVPDQDMKLFSSLRGPRRRVLSQQALLRGTGIWLLPVPTRYRLGSLVDIKIRQQWWCRGVGRISGWVTQQIVKLSSCDLVTTSNLLFIDSDVVFFRPFDVRSLVGRSPPVMHRSQLPESLREHARWHDAACRLLGLSPDGVLRHNYIGSLVVWRRELVLALRERLAESSGDRWYRALARQRAFSEYILYGVFCSTLAPDSKCVDFEEFRFALCCWTPPDQLNGPLLQQQLEPQHVALHLQSTLPISVDLRQRLLSELREVHA